MTRRALLLATALAAGTGSFCATHAQQLVIREGRLVRLTWSAPGTPPDWIQGTVFENSTGPSLVIIPTNAQLPTTVRLDASTRLQLYQGRQSSWRVGALVGGVLGAGLGASVLSSGFGRSGSSTSAFERSQAGIVFGAVGGFLGGLITHLTTGRPRWTSVALDDGRVRMPSLTIPWREAFQPLESRQRWSAFTPSDLDFTAFFQRHADSLLPVEGVWDVPGVSRFAIVRDQRYMEYDFVAIRVTRAFTALDNDRAGRLPGPVFAALRFGSSPAEWEMRVVDDRSDLRNQTIRAELNGPVLSIYVGDQLVERWLRVFP